MYFIKEAIELIAPVRFIIHTGSTTGKDIRRPFLRGHPFPDSP